MVTPCTILPRTRSGFGSFSSLRSGQSFLAVRPFFPLILGVYIDGRTVVLTVGFQVMGNHLAFGVLAHLVRDLFQSIWIDID